MMILKKGSQVKIITGKDKGKTGEILEISRSSNRVKIKAINIIKKRNKNNTHLCICALIAIKYLTDSNNSIT